jgi:hypothetical protein
MSRYATKKTCTGYVANPTPLEKHILVAWQYSATKFKWNNSVSVRSHTNMAFLGIMCIGAVFTGAIFAGVVYFHTANV